ncbi:MAG: hypothetical protein ACTHJL_00295 [Amnibacterium sp.]
MAPASADRTTALRALLVEQVATSGPPDRRAAAASPRRPEPGRFQLAIVSGVVAVVVVAASVAAMTLSRPPSVAPADHSRAVATAAPTAGPSETPTATPTPARVLVAPDGWRLRTRAELHDFVQHSPTLQQDPANAAIWEQETWTDIECMAAKGYVYDPIAEQQGRTPDRGLTADQLKAFDERLWGPPSSAPYDWRTAGCHGRSVHLAGQDHAN